VEEIFLIDDFKEKLHKLIHQAIHNFGGNSQAVVQIVDLLLNFAIKVRASDVHFEPLEKFLRVRYRIDGHLHELHEPLPIKFTNALISRIKILAKMDTTATFSPLDGAIKFGEVELRVASIPSIGAETMTIRLLNTSKNLQNISDLGFTSENEKIFRKMISQTSGMIILTGPMNSGKSTTLYAVLRELNQPARSIMTLEDPIEQHIEGISQIQVNEKVGLTFAAGLRAMLRMDCNCLMVGESRDAETSQIAVRAALTGHLIFTTLHAGDSCSAVFRMIEMGVEPYLLASTLKGVVAQRLVRKLCPHCKKIFPTNEVEEKIFNAKEIYKPVGCEKCGGTGYFGRIALQEILIVDKVLRELILNSRDLDKIQETALESGLKTLLVDGVEKVRQGLTTLEELQIILGENFL